MGDVIVVVAVENAWLPVRFHTRRNLTLVDHGVLWGFHWDDVENDNVVDASDYKDKYIIFLVNKLVFILLKQ